MVARLAIRWTDEDFSPHDSARFKAFYHSAGRIHKVFFSSQTAYCFPPGREEPVFCGKPLVRHVAMGAFRRIREDGTFNMEVKLDLRRSANCSDKSFLKV